MIRAFRPFLPACLALVFSGCAGGLAGSSLVDPPTSEADSPARSLARPGLAELVLTDRVWPTFAQAVANRVAAVTDGATVVAHLRAARTFGEIALPPANLPRGAYEAMPRLLLQVGRAASLDNLATCYVTLTPEDARRSELVIPLAPAGIRPGGLAADCFLSIAGAMSGAATRLEVRLEGFAGRVDGWLPVADLLAVSTVSADLSRGAKRYEALFEDAQRRSAEARNVGR